MVMPIDPRNLVNTAGTEPDQADLRAENAAQNAPVATPVSASYVAQDGVGPAAPAPAALAAASDAPVLPTAPEQPASPAATRSALDALGNFSDISAFAIIQQGQMKMMQLAGVTRLAAQKAVIGESLNAVRDLKAQIEGERESAKAKLAGAIVGAGASMGVGISGSAMRNAVDKPWTRNVGAGLDGSAQQIGNIFSSGIDLRDKLAGGGYQADQARIAQREDDVRKSIAQQVLDSTKSTYDMAEKALSNAMQAFSDYFKRKEGLMSNIANQ